MGIRKAVVIAITGGAIAFTLAACSNSPTAHQLTSSTTATSRVTGTTSTAPASPTTTTSTSSTSTTSIGPQNLAVTDQLRTELVAAYAAQNNLPASDYTGLAPGTTYYAFDPTTKTYWAAASVQPSSTSTQAQVSTQDDGSYEIFSMPSGGTTWKISEVGATGEEGSSCPASTIPASIVALWNWTPGSCLPPS